jgi:hypothetical protein
VLETYFASLNIVTWRCNCERSLDWILDLFITLAHNSELNLIAVSPLISTFHKTPQHPLSILQLAVSSRAIPWRRLPTVEILQHHTLKFCFHSLPYRTHLVAPVIFTITPRYGPCKNIPFPKVPLLLYVDSLQRERV